MDSFAPLKDLRHVRGELVEAARVRVRAARNDPKKPLAPAMVLARGRLRVCARDFCFVRHAHAFVSRDVSVDRLDLWTSVEEM